MTLDRLIGALVQSRNEAADDTLLEALRLGAEPEQAVVLAALVKRKTIHGLCGTFLLYDSLPPTLQEKLLAQLGEMHSALREASRSTNAGLRLASMKLIALGRQGKLAYVLAENLHDPSPEVAKAAADALVGLARWVSIRSKALQRGSKTEGAPTEQAGAPAANADAAKAAAEAADDYRWLTLQRPDIEQAVARAIDGHRGKHTPELLRAALLLADCATSKTLDILSATKHGGQAVMVRRLQQPPAAEHVEAFLLAASHSRLKPHFAAVFAHIEEAPVLDALLMRTHWLKDEALAACLHPVARGAWWGEVELERDLARRSPADAARIADWLAASAIQEGARDARLGRLREHARGDFGARLRIFRAACNQRGDKQGASAALLRSFLNDPDERLSRLAARELVRRRPADFENALIQCVGSAPPSVRRIISRSVGQSGFDQYWNRFDKLERPVRRRAGQAMLKLLPDAPQRLARKLASPAAEQRLRAMQVVQELKLTDALKDKLLPLCSDPNPKLRSKAVTVLGECKSLEPDALVDRLLNDPDPRVRANMIEVLEQRHKAKFVPVLVQRARSGTNRERANAIRLLHGVRMDVFDAALKLMLADPRAEHRISAMWALRSSGWWTRLSDVTRIARADPDLRVRRYALALLKVVSEMVKAQKEKNEGGSAPTEVAA